MDEWQGEENDRLDKQIKEENENYALLDKLQERLKHVSAIHDEKDYEELLQEIEDVKKIINRK